MKNVVRMNAEGRITVPTRARKALGLSEDAEFYIETSGDSIILKPVVLLLREDAWAYTAPHRRLLEKAHQDSRKGRVRKLSERQLERLGK